MENHPDIFVRSGRNRDPAGFKKNPANEIREPRCPGEYVHGRGTPLKTLIVLLDSRDQSGGDIPGENDRSAGASGGEPWARSGARIEHRKCLEGLCFFCFFFFFFSCSGRSFLPAPWTGRGPSCNSHRRQFDRLVRAAAFVVTFRGFSGIVFIRGCRRKEKRIQARKTVPAPCQKSRQPRWEGVLGGQNRHQARTGAGGKKSVDSFV